MLALREQYADFFADAETGDAETASLMQEAIDRAKEAFELLSRSGADASLQDKEGKTAADYAFKAKAGKSSGGADEL